MSFKASNSSFPECTDEDESIIQRRLVFDESMEDSYINLLQKMIVKWVLTDYKTVQESEKMYNKIMLQLSRINMFKKKSEKTRQRISEDTKFFNSVEKTMNDHVASITSTIANTEKLLKDAKKETARSANLKDLVNDVGRYESVNKLNFKKNQQEQELSELSETFRDIVNIEQKCQDQVLDMNKEFKKNQKQIKSLKVKIENKLQNI